MRFLSISILVSLVLTACSGSDPVVPTFGSVKGTVKDPTGQKNLSNVRISTMPGSSSLFTDAEGAYRIDNIVPGDYMLNALYIDTAYTASATVPIKVNSGSTTTADVVLSYGRPETGIIQGVVLNEQSKPVAGASVSTVPASMQTVTGADGKFMLYDLDLATYRVLARYEDLTAFASVDLQNTRYANVTLSLSGQDPQKGWVTGKVTSSGKSLSGVTVRIESQNLEIITSNDGVFTMQNVQPGSFYISFVKSGYQSSRSMITVSAGKATTSDAQLLAGSNISEQNLELYVPLDNSCEDRSPKMRQMSYVAGSYTTDRFGNPKGALECYGNGGASTGEAEQMNFLPITVGAWLYIPQGPIADCQILGKAKHPSGDGYNIAIEGETLIMAYVINSFSTYWRVDFPNIPRNQWFWVGFSVSPSDQGFGTINGTDVKTASPNKPFTNPTQNTSTFRIGSVETTSSHIGLVGKVDHVVVYSRTMSLQELKSIMEQGD